MRLPGVVGPGYTTPWIGQVLDSCLTDRPVEIHNPDAPFNNIVDTGEIARLFDHLLRRGGLTGHDTVNLGATEPLSVRRAVELVRTLADSSSDIVARASTAPSFLIDTTKVESRYGFMPAPVADMIARFVRANRPHAHRRSAPRSGRRQPAENLEDGAVGERFPQVHRIGGTETEHRLIAAIALGQRIPEPEEQGGALVHGAAMV